MNYYKSKDITNFNTYFCKKNKISGIIFSEEFYYFKSKNILDDYEEVSLEKYNDISRLTHVIVENITTNISENEILNSKLDYLTMLIE